ncbi:EAL domain-containing protein [Pseudoalteromonas xiamenensis]|uniref:EAL domain-containing protein n=1 Tax=Pseudoalteromonas xiamenensis TaxID=882626 RepID=UPI00244E31EA|nr:EAL domain-containing protein [Pseudoalteromonas xiamenensis]
MLEEALKQLTIWNTQGFNTKVSINIDSMQLNDPEFSQRVLSHLGDFTNVDPAQLELEILETNALEEIQNVSQLIEDLQSNDIQFALDDFGTGYSSMTFLKNLPATTIKIDQSFVRQMLFDSEQMIIVDSVINLSKRFGRTVLAEGVETELHGLFLSALGCEQAQGYGIAKPMPANEVLRWTQEWQCPTLWTQVRRLSPSEVDSLLLVVEHIGQCRALRIEHNHHTLRTTPFEKMDFINWFCSLASATDPRLHQINQQIPSEIESLRLALNHGQSCDDLAHQSNQIVANMLKVIFRDVDFELPSNCKMFEFD